jgi:S1-C subfamily serine protease
MKPQSSLPSMAPKSFAPKRFFIMSLLLNLLVSFVVSFTVCAVFLNQKRSLNPEDIYNMNISSVLEIRSTASSGYSYGSGVVIDQGKILTNAHVVSFLDSGKRTTFDKIEARDAFSTDYYPIEVKSYDENNDLALLTFSPSLFPKVSTITSDNGTLQTGSACFALGNSNNLGLGFSIMENVIDDLNYRGLIEQYSNEDNVRKLLSEKQTIYCGFDPERRFDALRQLRDDFDLDAPSKSRSPHHRGRRRGNRHDRRSFGEKQGAESSE